MDKIILFLGFEHFSVRIKRLNPISKRSKLRVLAGFEGHLPQCALWRVAPQVTEAKWRAWASGPTKRGAGASTCSGGPADGTGSRDRF